MSSSPSRHKWTSTPYSKYRTNGWECKKCGLWLQGSDKPPADFKCGAWQNGKYVGRLNCGEWLTFKVQNA